MGKNQGHKMRQMARHGGGGGSGDPAEGGGTGDGTHDASFHSAAWHEARIASLHVSIRLPPSSRCRSCACSRGTCSCLPRAGLQRQCCQRPCTRCGSTAAPADVCRAHPARSKSACRGTTTSGSSWRTS